MRRHFILLCFALSMLQAAEVDKDWKLPEKQVAEVSERWKLTKVAERMKTAGATGQQELLWEIMNLCDANEAARKDPSLEAVTAWLLFDAAIWNHPAILEPACARLPLLMPNVGAKLLDKRLEVWLSNVGNYRGSDPWQWPDFKRIDPKMMSAAVRRLMEGGPRHNPLTRLSIGGALLSIGDPDGIKEITASRALIKKNFSSQSLAAYGQFLDSLVTSGTRAVLLLLLEEAEEEPGSPGSPEERRRSRSLDRIYQLLGWTQATPQNVDPNVEIARLKPWLTANLESLVWDPAKQRFTSNIAPPGLEALYAAARAMEKKFDFKCLDRLNGSPNTLNSNDERLLLQQLFALMEKDGAAAQDPVTGQFLLAILDLRQQRWSYSENKSLLLGRLGKINPQLCTTVWARALRQALADSDGAVEGLFQQIEPDQAIVRAAAQMLWPEFRQTFDAAVAANDTQGALLAGVKLLFLGAKVDREQMAGLLAKAPPAWMPGPSESRLTRWTFVMFNTRQIGYLRMLLISATYDYALNKAFTQMDLGKFAHICGWSDYTTVPKDAGPELIAQDEAWLDQNEATLKWDAKKFRITGALSPAKAALAAALEPLTRHGMDPKPMLEGTSSRDDSLTARGLLVQILQRGIDKPDAAKDPALGKAAAALLEPARLDDDHLLRKRVYTQLSKVDRELAIKLWQEAIRRDITAAFKQRSYSGSFLQAEEAFSDVDPSVLKEARLRLQPELKALCDAADATPYQYAERSMAYAYLGGTPDFDKLSGIFVDAEKGRDMQWIPAINWGELTAKTGNVAGLRILLLYASAGKTKTFAALNSFEALSGLNHSSSKAPFANLEPVERVKSYLNWFNTVEAKLVWKPEDRRFLVPPAEPPPTAQPQSP